VNILRIDVPDRYAALELSRRLAHFRTYLVQAGRDRWFVAVEPDGDPDAVKAQVLETLQECVGDRGAEYVLHHGERSYPLRSPSRF
jgi:hypothetical protein